MLSTKVPSSIYLECRSHLGSVAFSVCIRMSTHSKTSSAEPFNPVSSKRKCQGFSSSHHLPENALTNVFSTFKPEMIDNHIMISKTKKTLSIRQSDNPSWTIQSKLYSLTPLNVLDQLSWVGPYDAQGAHARSPR